MKNHRYRKGAPVIYTKQKTSPSPGKRAAEITPASKGETYTYVVDKFWVVSDVLEDGTLLLRTRRGKEHHISPDDPMLRRATWWERMLYASRFRMTADGK